MARRTTMAAALVAALLTWGTVTALPAAAEEVAPAPTAPADQLPGGDAEPATGGPGATTDPDAPSAGAEPAPTEPVDDTEPTADPSAPALPGEPAPGDDTEQPAAGDATEPDDAALDDAVAEEDAVAEDAAEPQDAGQEEPAVARGAGPRPMAAPGDITLTLSTTCEDASVRADLTNTTDVAVDVLVRVTAEDGETSSQALVVQAAEQRSVEVHLGGAGEVEVEVVEVLEDDTERLIATGDTVVADCLEVQETCEAVVLTNPGGNQAVTLDYVDLLTGEELTEDLDPGESLMLPTDIQYVAAFSTDARVGAGEGYAGVDFEACGFQLGYVFSECRTDEGPGGALSFAFFVPPGTTATWTVTDSAGRVVEEGAVDEEIDTLSVTGLAPGTYTLQATTGAGAPEVSADVVVGRCLDVDLTCDQATFTNPASNPDALWVGLVDPDAPADPDSEDLFPIPGLELHEVPAGGSFTFALLEDGVPWIAGDLASLTMDPAGPNAFLGEGELPGRSTCPDPAPVDPTPAPVVDPVTDTGDDDGVPVATGAPGGGAAVVTGGHGGPVLAATGGPSGALGLLGLTALAAGAAVLRRRR